MISDCYFPRVNGVSTSIQTLRRELAAAGHEVLLLAPEYAPDTPTEDRVVRVPARRLPLDPEDRMMCAREVRRLAARLAPGRFDLIHIQTPFIAHRSGVALARRLGLPCVESYHTFFEEYLYHYLPLVPRAWLRLAARRFSARQCNAVDALVAPSSAMLERLRDYGVAVPARVIPTGLGSGEFGHGDGEGFRRRHGIPGHRPTLAFIGRVAHEKNIEFLLECLVRVRRRVPAVLLMIAGEGPARPALERMVRRLGLTDQVLFLGYLARDGALLDCYRAADAFVFASRTETQGLVLLEAMALGVPVVSTAVMGTREILAAGKGALVPPDDVASFADATVRLLTDPELRARLGQEGRTHARAWSAPVLASRMLDCYREVLARHAASRC
jgi:glycosyltransferase involved in cell wall biosynthesis